MSYYSKNRYKLKKLFIILLSVGSTAFAQTTVKNIQAKRTIQKVVIDGKIDEAAWKDAAKFKESSDKFVVEAAKLEAAAKTGNLDTIKAAFGAVGGSCKACHDAFRAE